MPLEAVIFDMDGVLVDSEPLYDRATSEYVRELGVEPDPRVYDLVRGLTVLDVWAVLADRFGLSQPVQELAGESIRRMNAFFEAVPDVIPRPGVLPLLGQLADDRIALAVASSSPAVRIEIILRRLALATRFHATVSGDDVRCGKPNPEVFLLAAERLGVRPESCAVVEDAARGVQAALAAGMRCVALDCGTDDPASLGSAHLVIEDLRDLTAARIRALW